MGRQDNAVPISAFTFGMVALVVRQFPPAVAPSEENVTAPSVGVAGGLLAERISTVLR